MKCTRCGSFKAELKEIDGDTYYVCEDCFEDAKEYSQFVLRSFLNGDSDCYIGFKGREIPELKRLFAQSENEDIRRLVEFLEGVEADLPKEESE